MSDNVILFQLTLIVMEKGHKTVIIVVVYSVLLVLLVSILLLTVLQNASKICDSLVIYSLIV